MRYVIRKARPSRTDVIAQHRLVGFITSTFYELDYLRRLHLQSSSQLEDRRNRWLVDSSFNEADVVALQISLQCQRLLRNTPPLTDLSEYKAKSCACRKFFLAQHTGQGSLSALDLSSQYIVNNWMNIGNFLRRAITPIVAATGVILGAACNAQTFGKPEDERKRIAPMAHDAEQLLELADKLRNIQNQKLISLAPIERKPRSVVERWKAQDEALSSYIKMFRELHGASAVLLNAVNLSLHVTERYPSRTHSTLLAGLL